MLVLAPKYSLAELERRYPRSAVVAGAPVAPLPPVAAPAPLPTVAEPLQLVRRGSVVGYPVVDSVGHPVGTVEAVAAIPATGEVRYAVITGPSIRAALPRRPGAAEFRYARDRELIQCCTGR
jgi:hypothetical protein